ncbi:hypothetical protein GQ53DRAFT_759601 [Thozetella sp. PMI_491]|nr:hypothetical protein GQ53DRAFT_759601 [Thozetella sp. PMI_491]
MTSRRNKRHNHIGYPLLSLGPWASEQNGKPSGRDGYGSARDSGGAPGANDTNGTTDAVGFTGGHVPWRRVAEGKSRQLGKVFPNASAPPASSTWVELWVRPFRVSYDHLISYDLNTAEPLAEEGSKFFNPPNWPPKVESAHHSGAGSSTL